MSTCSSLSLLLLINNLALAAVGGEHALTLHRKQSNDSRVALIVNGYESETRPFFVRVIRKVGFEQYHYCGGSIIDERWIITSAQCTPRAEESATNVIIHVHAGIFNSGEDNIETLYVIKAIRHPDFGAQPFDEHLPKFDIGLLKTYVKMSKHRIIPLCSERLLNCALLAACGLGAIQSNSRRQAPALHEALFIEVVSYFMYRCRPEYICARGIRGERTRLDNGDIGAPLFRLGQWALEPECLYGVGSYHKSFRPSQAEHPDTTTNDLNIFTSIPFVVDWIEAAVWAF